SPTSRERDEFNATQVNLDTGITVPLGETWQADAGAGVSRDEATDNIYLNNAFAAVSKNNNSATFADAKINGDVPLWDERSLEIALGGSYRHEFFVTKTNLSQGRASQKPRDIWSAFGEARTALFGDPKSKEGYAEVSAAVRWDDYTTFGSTVNPKV